MTHKWINLFLNWYCSSEGHSTRRNIFLFWSILIHFCYISENRQNISWKLYFFKKQNKGIQNQRPRRNGQFNFPPSQQPDTGFIWSIPHTDLLSPHKSSRSWYLLAARERKLRLTEMEFHIPYPSSLFSTAYLFVAVVVQSLRCVWLFATP